MNLNISKFSVIVLLLLIPIFCYGIEFIEVSEINKDDTGYGLTVFNENKIEQFPVTVISVIKNFLPAQDIILIKMSGDTLTFTGNIAGMSGSPIFIKNKLAGAVAYGWPYAKEALAGVTPIKKMMESLNFPVGKDDNGSQNRIRIFPAPDRKSDENIKSFITPLFVSGINSAVIKKVFAAFNINNLYPVQSGGYNSTMKFNDELVMGGPIGVMLMRGDVDLAAIGTITYIDTENKKLLAFGHSFQNSGYSDFPITGGYIHTVISRENMSFKLGSITDIKGRLYSDNMSCISAALDTYAELIKLNINIIDDVTKTNKKFYYELVDNKTFTPLLIFIGYLNSINTFYNSDRVNLKVKCRVEFSNSSFFDLDNVYAIDNSTDFLNFITPFGIFYYNRLKYPDIKNIRVEIEISSVFSKYIIDKIITDKIEYNPGDNVSLKIRLKKDLSETFESEFLTFSLPDDVEEGFYNLVIEGGSSIRLRDYYKIEKFEQLLSYWKDIPKNNILRVTLDTKEKQSVICGDKLKNLPESVNNIINDFNYENIPLLKFYDFATNSVISGQERVFIKISKKRVYDE